MVGLAAAWVLGAAMPCNAGAEDGAAQLSQIGQRFVDHALQHGDGEPAKAGNGLPLRMQVQMGQLDSRLRLAACAKVEPYLPPGSRLWGRSRLGLRCVQGAVHWNVFLPITVQAFGPAWVVQGNIPAGKTLSAEDAIPAEVDWAEDNAPVFANAQDFIGMVAARPLASGQTLRQNMVRPPALFTAGSPVQVMVNGGGFSISASGKAMSAAGEGQQVRVRMDNGRLVTGTVNANGVVVVQ
nr:flagellar basal body P-ring formation chaperone FlgA [Comamonas testosteroni]